MARIREFLARVDGVLRRRTWAVETAAVSILLAMIVMFGFAYGGVMGSYSGFGGQMWRQSLYSAVKVPLMLLATFAVSLPSFFVLNTLMGLRADFPLAFRSVLATQGALAVVLASLAPLTAVCYVSNLGYSAAVALNGLMFAIASFSAQVVLRGYYRPLIARSRKHLWMVRTWAVLYMLAGIEMGWMLRPFMGDPTSRVEFFRQERFENAYVIVARLVWRLLAQ